MSSNNQSNGSQNKFYCNVCKINFSTEGEYALHEFTNKHCDNLLKISKSKPIKSKLKEVKTESSVNKEEVKISVDTTQRNVTNYGHFIFGETYTVNSKSKEFKTECNSYLQTNAKDFLNEISVTYKIELEEKSTLQSTPSVVNKTGFKKIKKEFIRTCQICKVTLLTVSEYENHLKSSEHSHNLKMTGMGVSAQFVKESSDPPTTEINENSTSKEWHEQSNYEKMLLVENSKVISKIYCNICELTLNSEQQYIAHINGKPHNNFIKKKAEVEALKSCLEKSELNQLYCCICKLLLNNLSQYNDHKNGKKHKMNCKKLGMKMAIAPEEIVNTPNLQRSDLNKPMINPEMYQEPVPETEAANNRIDTNEWQMNMNNDKIFGANISDLNNVKTSFNAVPEHFYCENCNLNFIDAFDLEIHVKSHQESNKLNFQNCKQELINENIFDENNLQCELKLEKTDENVMENVMENSSGIVFHPDKVCSNAFEPASIDVGNNEWIAEQMESTSVAKENSNLKCFDNSVKTPEIIYKNMISVNQSREKSVLNLGESFMCTLCCENFVELAEFDYHLSGEKHAKQVQEFKNMGIRDDDLVQILLKDKTLVKANEFGRLTCSMCNVTTKNVETLFPHLYSFHHQRAEEEFKKRKMMEIKYSVSMNDAGQFVCKVCHEGYSTLVEYNQHLHTIEHSEGITEIEVNKIQTMDKDPFLRQKQLRQKYGLSGRKRRDSNWWRRKREKYPGMRTKVWDTPRNFYANSNSEENVGPSGNTSESKRTKTSFDIKLKRMDGRMKRYGSKLTGNSKNSKKFHYSTRHPVNSHSGSFRLYAPVAPHLAQHSRYPQPADFPRSRDSNSHHFRYWQPRFAPC